MFLIIIARIRFHIIIHKVHIVSPYELHNGLLFCSIVMNLIDVQIQSLIFTLITFFHHNVVLFYVLSHLKISGQD